MKVIVVNDFVTRTGGSHSVALDTAIALTESGIETHFVCGGSPDHSAHPDLLPSNIHFMRVGDVASLNLLAAVPNFLWSRKAYQEILGIFNSISADSSDTIVHIHSFTRCLSPSVFSAARRLGLPVVLTLHDYFAFSPNGIHFDFRTNQLIRRPLGPRDVFINLDRRAYSHHLLRMLRMSVLKCMKLIPTAVSRFIAVSEKSKEFASQFLPARKITTVYSPVQVQQQRFRPWTNEYVTFIGRLSREKGVLQLAEATRRMGLPVRFVGEGEDAGVIKKLNPAADITGWLDPDRVRDKLQSARVVVLPSRWHETFGLCVAESLAYGVPVVVSSLAGSSEWVTPGVNGFVFDPYHDNDLESQLARLQDDQTVRQLSDAAYKLFSERDTSRTAYAQQLKLVYHETLQHNASQGSERLVA